MRNLAPRRVLKYGEHTDLGKNLKKEQTMNGFLADCAFMVLIGVIILLGKYFGAGELVLAGLASFVALVVYGCARSMCTGMGVREGIKGLHVGMFLGFFLGAGLIGVFAKGDPIGLAAVAWFYGCTFSAMGGVVGAIAGITWNSYVRLS